MQNVGCVERGDLRQDCPWEGGRGFPINFREVYAMMGLKSWPYSRINQTKIIDTLLKA